MGLRLRLLYWWTPNYIIKRELKSLSDKTTEALQSLLSMNASKASGSPELEFKGKIEEQRAMMAQIHAEMVQELAAAVGQEKAVSLGRAALFSVGVELGKKIRGKLGVGNKPGDVILAAKILYRILGIEFHLEWLDDSNAIAIIDGCSLARSYSQLTCEVLSATDEGVIHGLQPNVTMKFKEYMTGGCKNCKAIIQFSSKEQT